MAVKNTPKHPIAVICLGGRSAGYLNNLFGVIILNRVVTGQLYEVVTCNTLSSADGERLFEATKLLSCLIGCQHLDDATPVVTSCLGDGPLANNGALSKFVGADYEDSPSG
jgi:hypothetical protein